MDFAVAYGFRHVTCSPKFAQSNGEAEGHVQTVKRLLKKAQDPYLALLAYRATPLSNGYSPAQLLMGWRLRTRMPKHPSLLTPELPDGAIVASVETFTSVPTRTRFGRVVVKPQRQDL